MNFSWPGDNILEDDISSFFSVGWGVRESVDRSAENFDLANILKELYSYLVTLVWPSGLETRSQQRRERRVM